MNQCSRKMLTVCWMSATIADGKNDELKSIQLLEIKGKKKKKVRHFSMGTMSDNNQTTPF